MEQISKFLQIMGVGGIKRAIQNGHRLPNWLKIWQGYVFKHMREARFTNTV